MNSQDYDYYWHILKDRQAELDRELEKEVWLRDPNQVPSTRRRLVVSLAVAAVLLIVVVASGAQLFV